MEVVVYKNGQVHVDSFIANPANGTDAGMFGKIQLGKGEISF